MSTASAWRRSGSWLVAIAVVIAAGVAALMLVPSLMGLDRYVITGASMSGTFERGSIVFEQRVAVDDLKVGDVITYLPPKGSGVNELVTHRILEITENPRVAGQRVLRTQGDANASADPWTFTLASSVQPKVVGWVPTLGWIFIALSMPGIRLLAIGLPASIIALLYLRDLIRAARG